MIKFSYDTASNIWHGNCAQEEIMAEPFSSAIKGSIIVRVPSRIVKCVCPGLGEMLREWAPT